MPTTTTDLPKQEQQRMPGVQGEMRPEPVIEDERYKGSGKLDGKVAIVTGGDSGIGAAVAICFAKEGADVAIVYETTAEDADAERVRARVEELGRRCVLLRGDLKEEAFCDEVTRRALEHLGHIDVLVNHAGEGWRNASLEEIPEGQMEELFRNNFFSMYYLTRKVLPHLEPGSAIVNTTSVTAYRGHPEQIDYASSKAAVVGFTRSLGVSLAKKGIRVNAVAPGPVWTPLIPTSHPAEKVETFGKNTELGRPAQPYEMAPAYVYLASEIDSSYMVGETLHLNGGQMTTS